MGKRFNFSMSGEACVFWALALLLLPLRWLIAAAAAAVFHEGCHYLALRLCGVRVYDFRAGIGGAVLETAPMSAGQELLCALAGPAGSLMMLFLIRRLPELAVCAGIQGVYNLLPIFPLDGGRAVRSLLELLWPGRGETTARWIQGAAVASVLALGLWASFCLRLGYGAVLLSFLMVRRALTGKIPCKAGRKRVQ